MFRYTFILLLFISFISHSKAQITDSSSHKEWVVKGFIKDEAKIWTSPLHYKKKDLGIAIPVVCAAALAIVYDENIQLNIQNLVSRNRGIKNTGSLITNGGGSIFPFALSGAFYLGGLAFKDEKAKQTGFLCVYALANTGVVITLGKIISGRQRPNADNGEDKWHWLADYKLSLSKGNLKFNGFDGSHNSFPSGHASVAWTLASVIATEYNDRKLVAPIAYTLATAVSLSRLTEDKHWLSDAIIGSAIGFGIGKFTVNHHRNTKWTLFPAYYKNNFILAGNYRL